MRITITGYVTEEFVSYVFAVKVTGDKVERDKVEPISFSDFQVGKEVRIDIPCTAYGFLDHSLKEDCAIMTISLKGVSNGETQKIHP